MADITGASSATTANSASSSHVISAPAGSSVGELMAMCVTMTGSQNPAVIDDHPDWVPVVKYRSTASNTSWEAWYYRYKQAGDSSWTITHTPGRGGSSILSMSGTATSDPIDVFSTEDHADNVGGIATVTAPSVLAAAAGTLLLSFGLRASVTGSGTLPWTWTTPINTTEQSTTNTTSQNARNGGHALFSQPWSGGGTGPRTSDNNNTGDGVGVALVVKDLVVTPSGPFQVHTGSGTLVSATLLGIHDGAGGFTPATYVGLSATTITFTDAFDRTGPDLGADWASTEDPMTIGSNQVLGAAAQSLARWTTDVLPGGTMFSEVTYVNGAGVGVAVAIPPYADGAFYGADSGTWYVFKRNNADSITKIAQKLDNSASQTTLVDNGPNLVDGDVIRLEYGPDENDVPTLTAYINGVVVLTHQPVSPITGQYGVGIFIGSGGPVGTPVMDNWTGGTR